MKNKIKKMCTFVLALVVGGSMLTASAESTTTLSTILSAGSTTAFLQDAIPEADLNEILEAGLFAANTSVEQPWYFVALTNQDIIDDINATDIDTSSESSETTDDSGEISDNLSASEVKLGDSPVAVIIYKNESTASVNASFDCGLACQNMILAANTLGYGAKVVYDPLATLNGIEHDTYCELLGVDTTLDAVAVLLIGYEDTTSTVSSDTIVSTIEEKVSFVE